MKGAAKPTDGWLARHLNRPVSRFVSRIFLALHWSPSHTTLLTLGIGLACAAFAAIPGWWTLVAAGILFQLASALDGSDGEVARVTFRESARGARLDSIGDNLTYVACLLGLVTGWLREQPGRVEVIVASALCVLVAVTLVTVFRFVRRYAPDASLVFFDRCVAKVAEEDEGIALRWVRRFFLLLRRDAFAVAFMLLSCLGSRALLLCVIAFGVVGATAVMVVLADRLRAAALALNPSSALNPAGSRGSAP